MRASIAIFNLTKIEIFETYRLDKAKLKHSLRIQYFHSIYESFKSKHCSEQFLNSNNVVSLCPVHTDNYEITLCMVLKLSFTQNIYYVTQHDRVSKDVRDKAGS